VVQQLRDKFFNPLEIVWFDPNVYNDENEAYAELLKEKLNIKVKTFIEFEGAVKFI
jgi:hypothetical protein